MESIKSYLRVPGLRLPSLASLRDGSFLTKALEKVDREAKKEQSFLKDFEVEIVTIKNICVTVKNIFPEPACAGAGGGGVELAPGQLRLGGGHSGRGVRAVNFAKFHSARRRPMYSVWRQH